MGLGAEVGHSAFNKAGQGWGMETKDWSRGQRRVNSRNESSEETAMSFLNEPGIKSY